MVISWLLTRLWWGIELSRLAIFRFKPRAAVSRIAPSQRELTISFWVFDRDTLYCVNAADEQLLITRATLETN